MGEAGGWVEPEVGRGLAAGEAAHFTVLCAGLVHEGAVEARPHGRGGGGGRGAAHRPVAQRAGGLPAHRTCRGGGVVSLASLTLQEVTPAEVLRTLTAQLLDGRPLLRLLPRLSQVLVGRLHRVQQQPDAVLEEGAQRQLPNTLAMSHFDIHGTDRWRWECSVYTHTHSHYLILFL